MTRNPSGWLLGAAWLLLSGLLLSGPAAWGQSPCPPVAPLPLDSADHGSLLRYLARSVTMNGLVEELVPQPVPWNRSVDDKVPCYPADTELARTGPYNDSLSCAGLCTFAYCPRNFAADVALLVQLRASFVLSAASSWDQPGRLVPGSPYLLAAGQVVADINAAFDCAGLPRPYVQASVLENVDENTTCSPPEVPCASWMKPGPPGTNSTVNNVLVPTWVIEEFRDELRASPADSAYYLDAAGQPRSTLHFNFFRLAYQFYGTDYSPDFSRLEGRMWLFYQAACYLNLGYTSLHLGQPMIWARLAKASADERPPILHRMAGLLARLRAYAARRPGLPPLLLTAEPMLDQQGNPVYFTDGTDAQGRPRLLFDFGLATMRPRETSPLLDKQDNPRPDNFRCPAVDPQVLAHTPCAGQYLATIDPCHGINFGPDGGGITALGFRFAQSPYTIYFDHGPTLQHRESGRLAAPDSLWPGNSGTWGWDDSAWFSRDLTDSCQMAWLRYELGHVRSFANSRGFLTLPGRLINNLQAGQPGRPDLGVPDYRLAAHPLVARALEQAWQPLAPQPTLSSAPGQGRLTGRCARQGLRRRWQQLPAWTLRVENPDLSSVYAWHLTGPAGPLAPLYGSQVRYLPPQAGTYTVELWQYNTALPAGVQRVPLPAATAEEECADRAVRRQGRQAARQAQPLIP